MQERFVVAGMEGEEEGGFGKNREAGEGAVPAGPSPRSISALDSGFRRIFERR